MQIAVRVLALALGSVAGANSSRAGDFYWAGGDDYWQSTAAWTPGGSYPGQGDNAFFTNAASYSVTLSNDVLSIKSNFFNNTPNTTATITLDLGTYAFNPSDDGIHPGAFAVGVETNSTTILYLASSTGLGKGLLVTNNANYSRVVVGRYGVGTLFITNGNALVGNTVLANSDDSRGTLVLSGPNTVWNNMNSLAVGNHSNSFGSSLVISNSATLYMGSSFRLGSGATKGGSSNNTVLLDTGARLFQNSSPVVIGYRSMGAAPSYNNAATVQGGAIWDNGWKTLIVGAYDSGVATGNVLAVATGGSVTNVRSLIITASNTLNLAGGLIQAGAITNSGTAQGFGTVVGSLTMMEGGFFTPFNSLGPLTFSNDLILASNATTTVQLGTNFSATAVASNLTLGGTLNVIDSGGLTTNTYTLFTYGGTLSYDVVTIGTAPAGYTYVIDTNTAGQVRLVVNYPPPVTDFSGSPTTGEVPLTVTFTNASTGVITNSFWDFGDGNTSNTTLTSFSHSYSFAGTYTVSLTASGPGGANTSTQSDYIVATNPPPPVAGFNVSTPGGLAPLAVTFTNTSTGNITNGFWDLGDGNTSNTTAATLDHTYAAGVYTVSLTVSGLGGSNAKIETNSITALEPAHLVINPGSLNFGSVTIGLTNSLTFSVINTGDASLTGVASGTTPFTVASGATYSVAGGQTQTVTVAFAPDAFTTFNGSVIFASDGGDSTNAVTGIGLTQASIAATPAAYDFGTLVTGTTAQTSFIVTNSGGTAVSNGTATLLGGPFSIVSGASFNVPGFGSTNITLQFAPVSAGGFTNSVAFASANGGVATNTLIGTGAIVPVAAFTGSPTNGPWPLAVTFTDVSTGTITNRFWNFGDGATTNTTATSLSHSYSAVGSNAVSLTVSGPVGTSTLGRTNYIVVVNPPHLVVNPASLNHGSVTIGHTNSLSFSVINTGDVALTGTATSSAPFSLTSGASYSVAGGQTGTVTVAFIPDAATPFNGSVIFASDGGDSTNAVTGIGLTQASIAATPAAYDFGTLVTGTTAQTSFVVTNSGGTAVSNGTATVLGGPFSIVSGASFGISGFGSTNVTVQFAPVSAGAFTNSVAFTTANGGVATNTLIGTGAIVPVAGFTGSPTNGTVPLAVTFTDSSTGTITNRFWNFGDGNTTNTSAASLIHTYAVAGTNTVTLTVSGPVGTSNQTRSDYIVGLNPAHLVVNPDSLDFGSVTIGHTTNLSFSAINTGDVSLTGTATSSAPFTVTSGSSYSVAGGQTQTVTVAFTPGSTATFSGWILFSSDGGNSINAVSGMGLTPGNIAVTPASQDFGTLATGTTAQASFVVTNSGGTAVSNGTATVLSGPFSIVSGASFSVPGFGSTNVTVQFAPVSAGAFTNSVAFTSANGGVATNSLIGTGAIVPVAAFTGSPTNGPWPLAVTFSDASTGTITNRFWNFGDGVTTNTTATSLSHSYSAVDSNTVSLTVSGPVGSSTLGRTNYIVVVNPPHLVVNPASLNHGSVTIGHTNSLSFSVINTGDVTLTGTATSAAPFSVTSGASYNVAGGQTGTVTVAFVPDAASTFNGSVIFASDGGPSTNAVTGIGLTPGSISATPASYNFGTLVTGTTAQASFVVTNSGGTAVSNGTAVATGGPFTVVSGATFSVSGFGSTNVIVQFAPVGAGGFTNSVAFATANGGVATNTLIGTGAIVPVAAFTGSPTSGPWPLAVTFTDTSAGTITNRFWNFGDGATTNTAATSLAHTYTVAATNTVSLTVSGPVGTSTLSRANYIVVVNPPHLVINPGSLNYGSVTIGHTNNLTFSAINTGDLSLSGTATGAPPFEVSSGATYNLAGGQTQSVTVAFAPDSVATFNGWVVFNSDGGTSINAVNGMGLTPGSITVTPASRDFGTVATGSTTQLSFTVTNSGGTAVSNGTAAVTGGPFSIVSGATFSVPGFGSTNVTVQFAPVSAGGFTNNVAFASANGGVATNTLIGTGAIVPVAAFTGSPTNGPWPLAVTFTDVSTGTITNRFWSFGDGATTNTIATSLSHSYSAVGSNTVSLTVSGPVGTSTLGRTNYIVVVNPPHLMVNPASLNHGSATIGHTNSLSFSVINTGDVVLTGTATSAAPFSVTSGASYSVAGGQTGTVTIAFVPDAATTFNGSVIFASDGGPSTNAVTGIGLTPGSIAATPASYDFGTLVTGTTAQASFVVTNSGGTAVSNGTAVATGGPFTVVSGATFSVSGFGSTNVIVQFAPVSAGGFTNNVAFASANGGVATNTLIGTGAIVPVAGFTASPTNGPWPLAVTFTDASTGTITNRFWNFGDGATTNTTATSLSHTYSAVGSNTVSLMASGPVGTSTLSRTNYIVVVNPPHLVVNPGSLNFGSVTIDHTNSLTFSAINTGDVTLTGTATGAAPFEVSSGATYNLGAGQTQSVTVAFAPGSAATFNGWVVFTSDGGNSVNAVSGAGLTPGSITATPVSHDFGTLATGTTAQTSFTVINSGGTAVSNGTATALGGPFSVVSGATFSVPGFGSTNVTVQFAPISASGFTNSVALATANGGVATNTLIGTGAIVPVASFTGSPTNGPWPLAVTFTDVSTGTITNRFWNFGDGATTNTTATSLSHSYSAVGSNTVSLTVSGPVGTGTLSRTNYIVVVNPPHLVVNPSNLNHGSVTIGHTNSLTFSAINTGDVTLTGTATSSAPFSVTSGASYSVAGGQTGTVTIAFVPDAAATFNGSVIFASDGGPSTNAVTGIGLTPGSIAVTPASHDFGTLATGTTAQTSFVVTNSGGTTVSNGTATVTGGPFTIASGATFSVSGFGTTNVTVQFAPVSAGAFTNSVAFATANGGVATNTLIGTGAIVPVASFTGSPTNGPWPLAVTFTDVSTGTISNRFWNFGDGATTNTIATSLSHTYSAVGSNTVSLTASGPVGTSTLSRANYIVVVNPPHLVVNPASLNHGSVTIGHTNSLSFSAINTGDVTLTGTATSSAPFSVASSASYNIAGGQTGTVTVVFVPDAATTFNGSVIFASDGGPSTNAVTGIGLTPGSIAASPAAHDFGTLATGTTAQASFVVTNSGSTAVSNGTATVLGGPFTVVSGATFSVSGFGSTNVTVQFAPVSAGAFTNSVAFATANGGVATNTLTGTGAIVPVAVFTGSPTNGTAPLAVTFTDSSAGTISNRHWDLGDGSVTNTTATSLSYTYASAGTNTVSLTVSGPVGTNTLMLTNYIVVGVPPVADFSASPTNSVAPFTVNFTDASSGEITNRLWSFGDSGTSNATSPSHVYTNAGTYSVSLTAFGPYGTDTKTQTNLIKVYATSATWTNANAGGLWSDASSWNPVTVPDLGSSVVFADAGTTATVDNASRIVGTITFSRPAAFFVDASGGASLTISNGIMVATNFTYTVSAPFVLGAANTWSVTNGGTLQLSGAISGANAITQTGSGTVTLSGTNTYGGGTVVSSGTLLVNNTGGSGTGTGTVAVASGATLGGHGVIGGPVVIANGGVFSPGGSVGTLTISNNLTFHNTSVLQYELGTNNDLAVVSGNLTLDGTLNVADAGGLTNGTHTLFTYGGTLITNGSASILTIGTVADSNMLYAVDISSNGFVKLVVLFPPPVADFGASQTVGMAPFTVTFTDSSSGPITNRFWNFGDGTTSNTLATSVEHMYNAGGNNSVQLIVSGPGGVSTNARVDYIIVAPPCDYPLSGTNASFGVTGGSSTVTVSPYTNVCAWTASSNDAWIQIDGGSITATGSAVVAYTVLSNASSSNARTGTMTVAGQTFTVTQAGDTTLPTIALTAPAPGIVSNSIAVSAAGTDDVAVVQVRFYRDGGVLVGTVSTPPYGVNFNTTAVSDGAHCFYALAYDAANNVGGSATNCVTVDNNAPSVPVGLTATAVATNQINLTWSASSDDGSGVAGYKVFRDGAQIATTAGTSYSDVGLTLGTTRCYKVAAYDNIGRVSAQSANACAQTFVMPGSLLGTYNGLAIQTNVPTHASSGSIRIKLSATGAFAANLSVGGTKAAFKGQFDVSGNATNTVTRKGLSSLQVILHLDLSYGSDQITGTVSDGVFTSELLADRMVYGKTAPCLLAGSYTLVLAPPGSDPDIPQGYGHGTLLVTTTGSGKLSGALADGTKLKGAVPMSKHGTGPLYSLLYKNQGACIGWVTFAASNQTLAATVDWFRPPAPTSVYYPAGFATNVALIGEIYVAPSAGGPSPAGDREITLGGGNLGSSLVETVTVDGAGNVVVRAPNSQGLTLKLTTQTGRFSGSFLHPTLNRSLTFNALTLQSDNSGAGYFLGTNASGYVIINPAP